MRQLQRPHVIGDPLEHRHIALIGTDIELPLAPLIATDEATDRGGQHQREGGNDRHHRPERAARTLLRELDPLAGVGLVGLVGVFVLVATRGCRRQRSSLLGRGDRDRAGALAAAHGRRPDDLRLGGRRGLGDVDDVGDDDGDIVRGAGLQAQLHEPIGCHARILPGGHDVLDRVERDKPGQAVGAQQITVAEVGLADDDVRVITLVAGEHARDEVAVRVGRGLGFGDPPLVDQRLDKRVVSRDLGQVVIAEQIPARVAQMRQRQGAPAAQDRGDRGPHPRKLRVIRDEASQLGVGPRDPVRQPARGLTTGVGVVIKVEQLGDDRRAREVTTGVPAHAVGDDEQVRAGIPAVLVVLAHHPDIGARRVVKGSRHPVSPATRRPSCRTAGWCQGPLGLRR